LLRPSKNPKTEKISAHNLLISRVIFLRKRQNRTFSTVSLGARLGADSRLTSSCPHRVWGWRTIIRLRPWFLVFFSDSTVVFWSRRRHLAMTGCCLANK
jgi:hypothetical protein